MNSIDKLLGIVIKLSKMENKLNANKILHNIIGKLYYDEFGDINNDKIESIYYLSSEDSVQIVLRDGQYFNITITTSK